MPAIFISHSSKDPEISERVASWLGTLGYERVFLDFDKETGLGAGEHWEQRLYQEIARCHAVLVILTPSWIASKWCFAEFTNARGQGKVIIPLVCAPGGNTLIAPEIQNLDLREWSAEGLSHLEGRLRSITDDIARGFAWSAGRPPYTGLESFEAEDAAVFFGRDQETRDVIAWLDARRIHGGEPRILLIHGASGSGKSSLLKAGVLPQLGRDKRRWIALPPVRPGRSPLGALAKVLAMAEKKPRDSARWRAILDDPDAVNRVGEVVDGIRYGDARQATAVFAFDQFEEIFTLAVAAERYAFLALLAGLCESARNLPLLVIATARSDLIYAQFASEGFALPYGERLLAPMPLDRVPRLVDEPAKVGALSLEPGLAERIARDVHQPQELPLLAFTLRDMYERFAKDHRLSIAEYESLGDPANGLDPIANAVSRRSAETIAHLSPRDDELAGLRDAFVPHLVRLRGDEGLWVRHPARRADLPDLSQRLIAGFVAARLLTALRTDGDDVVEVAHEALFSAWPMLAGWLEAERDFLRDLERLQAAHRIWLDAPEAERPGAVLRGLLLSRGRAWLDRYPGRFAKGHLAPLKEFIAASAVLADREAGERAAREKRMRLMRRIVLAASLAVAIITGVAAVLLKRGNNSLRAALWIAESQTALRDRRLEAAVENAKRAFDIDPTAESRSALISALIELSPRFQAVRTLEGKTGVALAWCEATVTVALASGETGEVNVSRPAPGRLEVTSRKEDLPKDFGEIGAVWPIDGCALLAVLRDGSVARIERNKPPAFLFRPQVSMTIDAGNASSIGKSGNKIAIASIEAGITLLSRPDLNSAFHLALVDVGRARAVDLSPDESKLAFGAEDGSVIVATLDTEKVRSIIPPAGDGGPVTSLRWSSDGHWLAIGTTNGTVAIVDPDAPGHKVEVSAASRPISTLSWSPATTDVAFGCGEGPVCLWRFSPKEPKFGRLVRFNGHRTALRSVVWSPDGNRLATLDVDNSLRFWTLDENKDVHFSLDASPAAELTSVVTTANSRVEAGANDGRLFTWELPGQEPKAIDDSASGRINALAVSHDTELAAARDDGSLTIWSPTAGTPVNKMLITGPLVQLAWSSGGQLLALSGDDKSIVSFVPQTGVSTSDYCAPANTQVEAIAWNPAWNELVVSSLDGVSIWDCSVKKQLRRLPEVGEKRVSALSLAVSSDGHWLATSGGANLFAVVYDLLNPKTEPYRLPTGVEAVAVAFSPDGKRLAVLASGGWASIWSMEAGKPERSAGFPAFAGTRESGDRIFASFMTWVGNGQLAFTGLSDSVEILSLDEGAWLHRASMIDRSVADLPK
jgi:WD40 repeat protein